MTELLKSLPADEQITMRYLISDMGYSKLDFYKILTLVRKYAGNIDSIVAELSIN